MLRGLFKLIVSLAFVAICLLVVMAGWLVCDGLMDQVDHVDIAMVPGHGDVLVNTADMTLRARLDLVIKLYQQHDFPTVVVYAGTAEDGSDEATVMAQYLLDHGLPGSAIVEDHQGTNTEQAVHHVVGYMDSSGLNSVLVVAPYYRITRLKMALKHAGITSISQAHTGIFQNGDLLAIGREALEVYYYMTKYYFLPTAATLTRQMEDEAQKMKTVTADKMNSIDK